MAQQAANDLEREMQEGLPQQRREWVIQRVVWLILYALLAGIILGLVGKGPLSGKTVSADDDSLVLEYERFLRHRSRDTLKLTLRAESDTVELRVDSRYLGRIDVEEVVPQPSRVVTGRDFQAYVFDAVPGGRVDARIEFQPDEIGGLAGWVSLGAGPRQAFEQFVYP